MKCSDVRYFEAPQVNIGDDAAETFLDQVLAAATICRQHLANKIPMKCLTQEQWREYNNATNCSICAKPFKSADKKVCDHVHLTGEYRGPAHNACNLNYRIDPKKVKIPSIIPNLKGIYVTAIFTIANFDSRFVSYIRETRKYLESFYVQQPNQSKTNNETEGEE